LLSNGSLEKVFPVIVKRAPPYTDETGVLAELRWILLTYPSVVIVSEPTAI
jgi:hypothetical protein